MGQPNPPGDIPLVDGLGVEWNDIVNAFPEDKRAELGPKLKERVTAVTSEYEPLKQWEQFQKSGITPEHADTALRLFTQIENNPKEVYETIGKYLNITPAQAEKVVKEVEKGDKDDPRIQTMQDQINTLAQVAIANREMSVQEQQAAEADAAVDEEIGSLKQKYGDFPEDEIIMRMLYSDMSAEEAFQDYNGRVAEIQKRRPSPMVMSGGGMVPAQPIDVRKLDSAGTKNLVTQMLDHANAENRK